MRRSGLRAGVITLAVGALLGGATVAIATPTDPCAQFVNTSNDAVSGYENYRYLDCRLDRQDAALKRIEDKLGTATPSPSATPSASPSASQTPSVTPSPSVTPTVTPSPSATVTPSATPTPTVTPSASVTPSATPTPTATPVGDCVGAANTPGGPDPWGGCWPGPHNTGYPQGLPGDTRAKVTLTNYTGPYLIRSCGVVIDGKTLNQDLIIEAGLPTKDLSKPCVTIKNSLVRGVIFAESNAYGPVLIQDTEVEPDGLSWWENVGRSNFTAIRVNSHGSEGVIKCDDNCVVKDSWIHGMQLGGAYHYNAIGGNSAQDFDIQHNYASCGDWQGTEPNVQPDAGCSAVIGFYGDYRAAERITINRNFLASTFPGDQNRQSGYCLNPGFYPGKPYGTTKDVTVTDNIFARGQSGKCGVFGPSNSLNKVGAPNGNTWSGNRYSDGGVIARPEE